MTDNNGDHKKFRKKLSLIETCVDRANELEKKLRESGNGLINGEKIWHPSFTGLHFMQFLAL